MKLRTHIREHTSFRSIAGPIEYTRWVLIPADKESKEKLLALTGKKTVAPLDEMLGVARLPFRMTVDLMLEIAWYGINSVSYKKAAEKITKRFGFTIDENETREITNYIGKIVYMEDCRQARLAEYALDDCKLPHDFDEEDNILIIMEDGAALETRHKVKQADGRESRWRENKLCVCYELKNTRTTSILNEKGEKTGERTHILKREYISYTGSVDVFKYHVLAMALRNGYGKAAKVAFVTDGADWIANMRDELFPGSIHVLDLFHAKEHIHEFSKIIFPDKEHAAKSWAGKLCKLLEDGEYDKVLAILKKYKNHPLPTGATNLYNYFKERKSMLNYPLYKSLKIPVGSGLVESGNRSVLQERMKGSGKRWNVPTARYALALLSKEKSTLWESYVVPLVKKQLLIDKIIPDRLPRSEKAILALEEKELKAAREKEKIEREKNKKSK